MAKSVRDAMTEDPARSAHRPSVVEGRATDARGAHRLAPITDDEQLVGNDHDRDITTKWSPRPLTPR